MLPSCSLSLHGNRFLCKFNGKSLARDQGLLNCLLGDSVRKARLVCSTHRASGPCCDADARGRPCHARTWRHVAGVLGQRVRAMRGRHRVAEARVERTGAQRAGSTGSQVADVL
eukprot:731105-Pleurochrysis_carterae.AAC.3